MKNLFYNSIARFGASFLVVIVNVFIARSYEKNDYAVYGYSFSAAIILSIFIQGGCPQSLMRFSISDEKNCKNYYIESTKIIRRNFFIACLVFLAASLFGISEFLNAKIVFAICLWAALSSWQSLLCEFYRVKNNLRQSAALAGGYSYVISIPMIVISYYANLEIIFCIFSHIFSIGFVCFFYHRPISSKNKKNIDAIDYSEFKSSGMKNMISSGFSTLIIQSPLILIGSFGTAADIAAYSVANRISAIVMMSYSTISQAFSRNISILIASGDLKSINAFAKKTTISVLFLMALIYSVLFFWGNSIISILFGDKYLDGFIYVKIICFGFLFSAITGLRSQFIVQSGGEIYLYKISILFGGFSLIGGACVMYIFGVIPGVMFSISSYCLSCVIEAIALFSKKKINCLPV